MHKEPKKNADKKNTNNYHPKKRRKTVMRYAISNETNPSYEELNTQKHSNDDGWKALHNMRLLCDHLFLGFYLNFNRNCRIFWHYPSQKLVGRFHLLKTKLSNKKQKYFNWMEQCTSISVWEDDKNTETQREKKAEIVFQLCWWFFRTASAAGAHTIRHAINFNT